MRKLKFMAFIAIICMLSLFVFAACDNGGAGTSEPDGSISASDTKGSDGEDKTELTAPVITLNDDYSVTWAAVEDATGYKVNVNGEELNVTAVITFPAFKVAGSYEIKVKAVGDNAESAYSNVVKYSAYSVKLTGGDGYSLTGENLVYGGKDYSFSFAIVGDAYKSSTPVIKVNGETVTAGEDGKYTFKNVDKNLIVTVEGVKKTEFAVTIPVGEGYEVKGADKVAYGENYSFEVQKKDGYDKSSLTVKVNGTVAEAGEDGKYTVENVTAALTITVEGATKNVYNVTLPKSVAFTVTGNATAVYGENYSFVLEIKDGYDKTNLVVKANEMRIAAGEDGKTYTLTNVTEDQTITVDGLDIIKYDVTLTAGTGYVLTGEAKVEHGGNYSFELAINEGYTNSVPVVKANGKVVEGEDGKYTVENVTAALTITVEGVVRNTYTVSVAEGTGFTADAAEKTVNHGESVSFTVTAENADDVIKVYNGETEIVSAEGVYTVENVTSDVTLTVKVYDLANQILLASNWDSYDGTTVAESINGITVRGWQFGISAEYLQKTIEKGYTHLRFDYTTVNHTDGTNQGVYMEAQGTDYQKCYPGQGVARFDLTMFKKEDNSYANILMQGRNSESWGDAKDIAITVTAAALFKSEETTKWTKSNPKIYCAIEEDGYIVLDTIYAGNDAHVLSTAEWWKRYAGNPIASEASQNTIVLTGRYLNAGGNSRGAVFGGAGTGVGIIGGTANTEFYTDYMNNLVYAEGNQFYCGLDKEGVYQLKVGDFVSSRNSSGGFSVDFTGGNSFKLVMPNGGKFVYIFTQDMIAAGYKKIRVTASEYTSGQVWIGNDNWTPGSGGMTGLNSEETKELDLSLFTEEYPYFQVFASENIDVTITYEFIK